MSGEWLTIAQRILKQKETVMVLGKTDSGKTSTVCLFTQYLVRRNRKVAVIDGDIGQSTLGPPGTVNMGILEFQNLKTGMNPITHTVFIGATSPERCIQKCIDGLGKLNKIGQQSIADAVLIDTTGLISGNLGIILKRGLIERIKPTILMAIQFAEELEPILKSVENQASINIFRLKPCQNIHQKKWLERKVRRKKQFSAYFEKAVFKEFSFSEAWLKGPYFGQGYFFERKEIETINTRYQINLVTAEREESRIILITKGHQNELSSDKIRDIKNEFAVPRIILLSESWFPYFLVSFTNQEGLSKGLGIIQEIDFRQKKLMAYIPHSVIPNNFTRIEIGQVRIKPDGTELPFQQPDTV